MSTQCFVPLYGLWEACSDITMNSPSWILFAMPSALSGLITPWSIKRPWFARPFQPVINSGSYWEQFANKVYRQAIAINDLHGFPPPLECHLQGLKSSHNETRCNQIRAAQSSNVQKLECMFLLGILCYIRLGSVAYHCQTATLHRCWTRIMVTKKSTA